LRRKAIQVIRDAVQPLASPVDGADRGTQIILAMQYAERARNGNLPSFFEVEFRNHSQGGEDGILLLIFSVIEMGSRRAVEICAGAGIESNTANLVLHHGWDALLVDGNASLVERGRAFYASQNETFRIGPTFVQEWVTVENVNDLLTRHGFDSELDLLSIDIDGNDYWVLKAIQVRPRVIVCEYNKSIPAGEALTIPYDPQFIVAPGPPGKPWWRDGDQFYGASLDAIVALLKSRGYRLVGANRQNTNAFFLRDNVGLQFPEVSTTECLVSKWAQHMQRKAWDSLRHREWVRVSSIDEPDT
jgi:hypothetical protein